MTLRRFLFKNWEVPFLCFCAPLLVILAVYADHGMYPFGPKTVLIMDMSNQYAEFFAGLKHLVSGKSSFFYSWSNGMGGPNLGLIAYYLSSPLSTLTLLFTPNALPLGIMLLNILKIGLSGLAFCFYLRHRFDRSDLSLVWFSTCYATMSYAVAYSMNIMWLDGLIWLPVIMMGIEKVLKGQPPGLLILSYAAAFISSYYISYMIGIFSVIYFIYRCLCSSTLKQPAFFLKRAASVLYAALLAAGLSAWLLVPAGFSMLLGKLGGQNYMPHRTFNFLLPDLMFKLFVGSADSVTTAGLPNIFCGTAIIVLVIVFFSITTIPRREKMLTLGVLLFFLLSFIWLPLDVAWHVYQYPNWFPYRFAFLFVFFAVSVAYRAYTQLEHAWGALFYPLLAAGAAAVLYAYNADYTSLSVERILLSYVLFCLYSGIFLLQKPAHRSSSRVAALLVTFLAAFEMFVNGSYIVDSLDREFEYRTVASYQDFHARVQPLVDWTQQQDPGFYRMENTNPRAHNNPVSLGYRGITHYSSTHNRNVTELLRQMGFAKPSIYTTFSGNTPATSSLLGIKYLLTPLEAYPGFETIRSGNEYHVMKNPNALGIAFVVDANTPMTMNQQADPLEYQNNLLREMSGSPRQIFIPLESGPVEQNNIRTTPHQGYTVYSKSGQDDATLTYRLQTDEAGPLFATFLTKAYSYGDIYVNERKLGVHFTPSTKANLYLGDFKADEPVNVTIELFDKQLALEDARFYILDLKALEAATAVLKKQEMVIESFSADSLEGEVDIRKGQYLFTSIPYDKSWQIEVDGKPFEPAPFANALMTLQLPPGKHHIEMRYVPKGWYLGASITGFSLLILILGWQRSRQAFL